MAQLRDSQTSELLADGAPEELALVARELAGGVLFDDVGAAFDPELVLTARAERIEYAEDPSADQARGLELKALAGDVDAIRESARDPDAPTLPPLNLDA